jgi:hypothetical protein
MLADDLGPFAGVFRALGLLLLIFGALYAIDLTTTSLLIDDELIALSERHDYFVAHGRWVTYLFVRFMMPQPVVPFLPVALFGLLMAIAYLILLRAIEFPLNRVEAYLTFPLFCGFPIWFFATEFHPNKPVEGVGVLAASAAASLVAAALHVRSGRRADAGARALQFGAAVGLGAVAIGVYQANAMLLAVLGLVLIVFRAMADGDKDVRTILLEVAQLAGTVALSLVAYMAVLATFRSALQVAPEYVDGFVRLDALVDQPVVVLRRTVRAAWRVYTGHRAVYGLTAFAFGLVLLAGGMALAGTPRLAGRPAVRVALLGLLGVMLLAPFAIHPFSNGWLPYRSLIGVPAIMWFCGFLALTAPIRWLYRLTLLIVAIATYQTLYIGNLLQAGSALARQHDGLVAGAIYNRVAEVHADFDRNHAYKLALYGAWPFATPYPKIDTSTSGSSFFEWGQGNPYRMVNFMRMLGFGNVTVASPEEHQAFKEAFAAMPIWPAQGSVVVKGDVTLVKLGERP